MTEENVVYLAKQPPYVVQQLEVEYYDGSANASEIWLDIKGFDSDVHAKQYADKQKRRDPATDYRVVKTGE